MIGVDYKKNDPLNYQNVFLMGTAYGLLVSVHGPFLLWSIFTVTKELSYQGNQDSICGSHVIQGLHISYIYSLSDLRANRIRAISDVESKPKSVA